MNGESDTLLVFSRRNNSLWLENKLRELSSKFDSTYVINSDGSAFTLTDIQNIKTKNLDEFISSNIVEQTRKFQGEFVVGISKQIIINESLLQNFLIDNLNTWWFLPNKIFGHVRDHEFISFVDAISNIITEINPSSILLDTSNKQFNILKEICKDKGIKIVSQKLLFKKLHKKFIEFAINVFTGPKRMLHSMLFLRWSKKVVKKYPRKETINPTISYLSHASNVRLGYTLEGKLEQHEIYQKNIQLEIDKLGAYDHYSIEVLDNLSEREKFDTIHKIRTQMNNIPIFYYHTLGISLRTNKNRRIVHRRLKRLFKNNDFKKAFTYQGVSLLDVNRFQLFRIFKTEMSNAYEKYTLFLKLLEEIKPKVIVLHNEHAANGKAFIYSAKTLGIPTIAIQHGFINFASPEYFVSNNMICDEENHDVDDKCNHVADLTCVHGNNTKELITKFGGYPKNRVEIVGSAQWDVILKKEIFNKNDFLEKLGFNSKKKTVVILSQALPVIANRDYFNLNIAETLKENFSDLQLIWKPHPREDEQKIANLINDKYNLTSAIVQKNLPLFDVLNVCDVAITVHSTTGLEAMFFDKPVITFIPPNEEENTLFKNSGAVLKVETKEELVNAINQSLYDDSAQKKLTMNRKKLIKDLIKFDGKASSRYARIITQIAK